MVSSVCSDGYFQFWHVQDSPIGPWQGGQGLPLNPSADHFLRVPASFRIVTSTNYTESRRVASRIHDASDWWKNHQSYLPSIPTNFTTMSNSQLHPQPVDKFRIEHTSSFGAHVREC